MADRTKPTANENCTCKSNVFIANYPNVVTFLTMSSSWLSKLPNRVESTLYWISNEDNYIDKIVLFGVVTSLLRKVFHRDVGSPSRVMNVGVDLLPEQIVFDIQVDTRFII